ncbi:MAG TPA: VOC family protein [Bryobacteraceae bacterium]|nr:VOC family protein [Bryobacteraceae bacterium]
MPHIDSHPAGGFCWFELGTTDQDAAKTFYSSLFGWTPVDNPMGPSFTYTIFKLEGRDAAAAYTLMPDMVANGVPPHWMVYVAADSADASAQKAAELGGKVMAPPMDVMDFGRMAILQDPAGAAISVWQPGTNKGTQITGEPGTACWADLNTPDRDTAVQFYGGLFGWTFSKGEGNNYLHIRNGGEMIGGVPPAENRDPHAPPHWLLYFLVSDCDATTAQAKKLGANILFGPMTMDKVGRMAFIADPQGAVFALYQPVH